MAEETILIWVQNEKILCSEVTIWRPKDSRFPTICVFWIYIKSEGWKNILCEASLICRSAFSFNLTTSRKTVQKDGKIFRKIKNFPTPGEKGNILLEPDRVHFSKSMIEWNNITSEEAQPPFILKTKQNMKLQKFLSRLTQPPISRSHPKVQQPQAKHPLTLSQNLFYKFKQEARLIFYNK